MSGFQKYVRLIESANSINEGVKIGNKELQQTLENSDDYLMGIEYEMIMPLGDGDEGITDAHSFARKYKIKKIHNIVPEHGGMIEVITETMSIEEGLAHIKQFFDAAKEYGIKFPDDSGLHVSISHRKHSERKINFSKFLVLSSANYLHDIFPERSHVKNIASLMRRELLMKEPSTVSEAENIIESIVMGNKGEEYTKYITTKLKDYFTSSGRIELRYFGGKDYHERFDDVKRLILRSVYIIGIAYDETLYRKEYLKSLMKLIEPIPVSELSPKQCATILLNNPNSKQRKELIKKITTDAEISYRYAKDGKLDSFPEGERIISKSAYYSYMYAFKVLKGRFELGEDTIATNLENSFLYAAKVLEGSFEKGEDIIITSAHYSFIYATEILRGRFEKGEDIIATNAGFSYTYANTILKGKFEKAEHIIATDAKYSYLYALNVLKGRFELGEDTIASDEDYSYLYALKVLEGRFEKGEDVIAKDPEYAFQYASEIIKGRFEKGEDAIAQSGENSFMYALDVINARFEKGEPAIQAILSSEDSVEYSERFGVKL